MKTIYFATGNKGKVESLQNRMPEGYMVEQVSIDIPEIQHDNVEEIVRAKAHIAFERFGKPVVVQDSAFHIDALGGFPGPYIKYVNTTIGAAGIIKLMEGESNRRAYFRMALGYADTQGVVRTFTNNIAKGGGMIAQAIAHVESNKAWSQIWKIYIPKWTRGRTLMELTEEEINIHEQEADTSSEFYHFTQWLTENDDDHINGR